MIFDEVENMGRYGRISWVMRSYYTMRRSMGDPEGRALLQQWRHRLAQDVKDISLLSPDSVLSFEQIIKVILNTLPAMFLLIVLRT